LYYLVKQFKQELELTEFRYWHLLHYRFNGYAIMTAYMRRKYICVTISQHNFSPYFMLFELFN